MTDSSTPASKIKSSEDKLKRELLHEVSGKVNELVEQFTNETGLAVRDVQFELTNASELGKGEPKRIVVGVRVEREWG